MFDEFYVGCGVGGFGLGFYLCGLEVDVGGVFWEGCVLCEEFGGGWLFLLDFGLCDFFVRCL